MSRNGRVSEMIRYNIARLLYASCCEKHLTVSTFVISIRGQSVILFPSFYKATNQCNKIHMLETHWDGYSFLNALSHVHFSGILEFKYLESVCWKESSVSTIYRMQEEAMIGWLSQLKANMRTKLFLTIILPDQNHTNWTNERTNSSYEKHWTLVSLTAWTYFLINRITIEVIFIIWPICCITTFRLLRLTILKRGYSGVFKYCNDFPPPVFQFFLALIHMIPIECFCA